MVPIPFYRDGGREGYSCVSQPWVFHSTGIYLFGLQALSFSHGFLMKGSWKTFGPSGGRVQSCFDLVWY